MSLIPNKGPLESFRDVLAETGVCEVCGHRSAPAIAPVTPFTPDFSGGCNDCGRPYGDEHGFPDLVIENYLWRRISPTGDDCGVLCPSCMLKRLWAIGVRGCYGALMSGAVWSVNRPTMEALRRAENLEEREERARRATEDRSP